MPAEGRWGGGAGKACQKGLLEPHLEEVLTKVLALTVKTVQRFARFLERYVRIT